MSIPWFFISYASMGSGSTNDACVEQFYNDLVEELRTSAQLDETVPAAEIGFFAKTGMGDGTIWPEALAESLRKCRVLVCLYSGKYFSSIPCGREFTIFNSRVDAYAEGPPKRQRPPLIVPVIWVVPDDFPRALPPAVSKIDYKNEHLDKIVKAEGLYYYLKSKAKYKDEYDDFVSHLAKKIKAVAVKHSLSELAEVHPFEEVASAFHKRIEPPAAPSELVAEAVSSSQIRLTWKDNSPDEEGFRVERRQGAGSTDFKQIREVGSDINTFLNTGLAPETSYTYRVRAFNEGGRSDYSNEAMATTPWSSISWTRPRLLFAAGIASLVLLTALVLLIPGLRERLGLTASTSNTGKSNTALLHPPNIKKDYWSPGFNNDGTPDKPHWSSGMSWDTPGWQPSWGAQGTEGVLVVQGDGAGVVKAFDFDDFEAAFPVKFETGKKAGWILRTQGDRSSGYSGYCFILERTSDAFQLVSYWGQPQKLPAALPEPQRIPIIDYHDQNNDSIEVTIKAEGNTISLAFRLSHPTPNSNRIDLKECFTAFAHIRAEHPSYGYVGFFAGDNESRFSVESLTMSPIAPDYVKLFTCNRPGPEFDIR
jgi:hypothetical protein